MPAKVNLELCVGCGVCEENCPEGAITLNSHAVVDPSKCVECGSCVEVCPQGAINIG